MLSLAHNQLISETTLFAMPELPTDNSAVMEAAIIFEAYRHDKARRLAGALTFLRAEKIVKACFQELEASAQPRLAELDAIETAALERSATFLYDEISEFLEIAG